MASSVLLISLEGIQSQSVQEVVQARGIDKVIVVSSASGFSSQAAIPGINAAAQVRDDKGIDVQLATTNGGNIAINPDVYAAIGNAGLTFLNDSGLQSLEGSLLATTSILQTPTSSEVLPVLSVKNLTAATLDNGLSLEKDFGEVSTIVGPPDDQPVSDFNGSVKVNLSATQFADFLSDGSFEEVTFPSNINVIQDQALKPELIEARFIGLAPEEVEEFDGTNQRANITSVFLEDYQTTQVMQILTISGDRMFLKMKAMI